MRVFSFVFAMPGCRDGDEHGGKHRKDEPLDEPYEYLKKEERQGNEVRSEECHDGEEYFARENIAKETKRERDDFSKFSHEFKEADEGIDTFKIEEL